MIVYVFSPYNLRHNATSQLREFYWLLSNIDTENVGIIAPDSYFWPLERHKSAGRWEANADAHSFSLPTEEQIKKIAKSIIPTRRIEDEISSYSSTMDFEVDFLSVSNTTYELDLLQAFNDFNIRYGEIDAVIHISNCKPLERVCNILGIRLYFWEGSPLRSPFFNYQIYLDSNGIGENTSVELITKYYENAEREFCSIFSNDDLLFLISTPHWKTLKRTSSFTYKVGVPLQVEVDNNIIAFSNDWNSIKLMDAARLGAGYENTLIRQHPLGIATYTPKYGTLDSSDDSISFILKSKSILTINSSVGFEASMLGLPVFLLGESPFAFLCNGGVRDFFKYCENGTLNDVDDYQYRSRLISSLLFGVLCPVENFIDIRKLHQRIENNDFVTAATQNIDFYAVKFGLTYPADVVDLCQKAHYLKNAIREQVEFHKALLHDLLSDNC